MNIDEGSCSKNLRINKKWCQLNPKQQIRVSTILRDNYINFVWGNDRKPDKVEKELIIARTYLELGEEKIYISETELRRYFESKLHKYDNSIDKLNAILE